MIYPARCLICGDTVSSDFGLCGGCWRDTPFLGGARCDSCATPLPGSDASELLQCDACMQSPPPWEKGRSALLYRDNARKLVLALKHGDRQEIARPAGLWMSRALRDLPLDGALLVPVPLHWMRLLKRRYNQSALLADALSREMGLPTCPDLLLRPRRTPSLDGKSRADRFALLTDSIRVHPRRRQRIIGRTVLLVDDVMTTGATMTACATACLEAGASAVFTVTLARVAKDT